MLPTSSRVLGTALLVVSFALALTVYGRTNAEKGEKNGQPSAEPLKQLMDRIGKLEARVAELEKRQRVIVVPRQPPGLLPKRQVPQGWTEKEFNGLPYYIVPLDKGER